MIIPKLLITLYIFAVLECCLRGNYAKAMYWIGAILIVGSIEFMN